MGTERTANRWHNRKTLMPGLAQCFLSALIALNATGSFAADCHCHKKTTDGQLTAEQKASLETLKADAQSTTLQGGTESTLLQGGANSTTLQGGTESTLLKGGTDSTLLKGGTDSTLLKTGTDSTLLKTGTENTLLQGNAQRQAIVNVLILLDSSQTMMEGLHGAVTEKEEQKLSVAKRVIGDTLKVIPEEVNVGLRVFGNSFNNDPNSDCRQSVLLVPIGERNRKQIVDEVQELQPRGMTPLAYTLMQAANDFQGLPGIHHIVLVSDGFETCGGDPCTYIKRLVAMGIQMKIDIVGLGLKRDKIAKQHLSCLSESSGGHYYDADTAGQLAESLKNSFQNAVGEGQVSGKVILGPKALKAAPAMQLIVPTR